MVQRETRAWDRQNAAALIELFHPDMAWPWPPTPHAHDPVEWTTGMGRFNRERWTRIWQELFDTHTLVHNRREIRRVSVSPEADAGFAVVDIDTLWQRTRDGAVNHWHGRVCKIYTKMPTGWLLVAHTGALLYEP
jgi:ketosteroid isomerase-like protein